MIWIAVALGETFLLSTKEKMGMTWSKQDLVTAMTCKVVAADCTCTFLPVDRVRRRVCVCVLYRSRGILCDFTYSAKSQNPSTAGAGRGLWGSPSPTPAEAGSPRAGCTGPCPGGAWISPEKTHWVWLDIWKLPRVLLCSDSVTHVGNPN